MIPLPLVALLAAAAAGGPSAGAAPGDLPLGGTPGLPPTFGASLAAGTLFWAGVVCLAAAAALLWRGRAAGQDPRGSGPGQDTTPRTVDAEDLDLAVRGPLAAHRLLVVGEGPPPPGGRLVPPGAMPAEILGALDQLARTPGPPPALLVQSPRTLEAWDHDPIQELRGLLAGRHPLWVVNGPQGWDRWQPKSRGGR